MKPNGYVQIDKCNLCTLAATAVVYLEMEYDDVHNSKNLAGAEFTNSRTQTKLGNYMILFVNQMSLCKISLR